MNHIIFSKFRNAHSSITKQDLYQHIFLLQTRVIVINFLSSAIICSNTDIAIRIQNNLVLVSLFVLHASVPRGYKLASLLFLICFTVIT